MGVDGLFNHWAELPLQTNGDLLVVNEPTCLKSIWQLSKRVFCHAATQKIAIAQTTIIPKIIKLNSYKRGGLISLTLTCLRSHCQGGQHQNLLTQLPHLRTLGSYSEHRFVRVCL